MLLPWVEKYRPKTLDEIIGQDEIVASLKAFVKKKNMPHLLFAGPPGVGKTTATLALARELFGEDFKSSLLELNASDERGIDIVRGKIKDFARTVALSEVPFKIVFLDEADSLTADAQHALRRTMELYSNITRFILSCNYSSKIIQPIQSRCAVFRFSYLSEDDIKKMLNRIIKSEKLKVDKKALEAIIYISEGDMRKAINALQGAAMLSSHITAEAIFKLSSRAHPTEVRNLLEEAVNGSFTKAKEYLNKLMRDYSMSGEDILLQMYREIENVNLPEKTKVELVDKIGEYDFRLVEGANERIQLEALLAQLRLIGMKK
ncbi:replication factor C small subunit [Candidatus Micrarchaeota archaeon]|nr:replication factor C small subunit [Candidatus Micrarchaeota archaeon]